MADRNDPVYAFAPLDEYTFKERLLIRIVDLACYAAVGLVGLTMRYEVEGWDNYEKVIASGRLPVWPFWHDRILASTLYFRDRGILVITSKSKDGEYIARLIQRFGFGVVRGSTSRGAARALIDMKRQMAAGRELAFTVDGPRGPRYEAKPGPVYLAKLTGNPVLPFLVECKSYWTLNSWDRLQIPKPFSKALVMIAEPFDVPKNAVDAEVERKVSEMQTALDGLVRRGLEWRSVGRPRR